MKNKEYKKELQNKLLEMLKYLDNLCKENNIEYYLMYGTALGAVRHQGFIPWDDDVDVGMTDENYNKFIEVCSKQLDKEKYFLQTPENEKNYYLSFSKLRDITTTLVEEGNKNIDIIRSVYIDIFPLVGVPNNKVKRIILKANRIFMLSANVNIINNKFVSKIVEKFIKIVGKKRIIEHCRKNCFKYKVKNCENLVSIADGDGFEINEMNKKVFGKPKYIKFEDYEFPVPENVEQYLTQIFGDYMQIPTKGEIEYKEHTPYFVDFTLPYKEYKRMICEENKKKLLFIIWSFTSGGGAEKILETIVINLDRNKYEIDILEYWHSDFNKNDLPSNVHLLQPIVNKNTDNKFVRIIKMFTVYFFPSILRKIYCNKKYDVEISFNYLIPSFLLNKNTKSIAWIHGDIYDLKDNKFKYYLQKKSLKKVNRIVSISDNTYNSIKDVYPQYIDKLIKINNLYDFDEITTKSKEVKLKKEKSVKNILFLGRFDENKNPLYLLDVISKLNVKNFKLIYMGQGNLKKDLMSEIQTKKLNEFVEIIDYKTNPYPYIKNSDILASCSYSEGFPTIIVEGMIFGKPFISTKVGGVTELSNESNCGFVVENIDEYIKYLSMLINDEKLYNEMSENCKKFVQRYSSQKQIKVIEDLFESL